MRRVFVVLVGGSFLLLLLSFFLPKPSTPVLPSPSVVGISTVLQEKSAQIVRRVGQVCAELHLESMPIALVPMKFEADPDEYGSEPVPKFKLDDRRAYRFTFLQCDQSLIQFLNERLFDQLFENKAPVYDKPVPPKWTEDNAIKVGRAFLDAFSSEIRIKLGSPNAKYNNPIQNNKYHVGQWTIYWPRIDGKGNVFSEDRVIMEISEGYGPTLLQIQQSTPYLEESGQPMKYAEALDKIQRRIASDRFWDRIESVNPLHQSEGWTDPKPSNVYLQIVTPRGEKNPSARLAWIFWFKQHSSIPLIDPPHPPIYTYYPISYWIDAYTGEIIGGDVVGLDTPE